MICDIHSKLPREIAYPFLLGSRFLFLKPQPSNVLLSPNNAQQGYLNYFMLVVHKSCLVSDEHCLTGHFTV